MNISQIRYFFTLCAIILLAPFSCSRPFDAFIRNNTGDAFTLHVTIRDKTHWRHLPNQVRAATRILRISSGIKGRLDTVLLVQWQDTSRFQLKLPAQNTVYLNDLLGSFMNSHPHVDCLAVITSDDYRDTLLNGRADFRHDRFAFTPIFFGPDVLHYDMQVSATP